MHPKPHIAVIGAGAFGGWTALHLLERGARVTLIDAWGPGNSRASSGGETRIMRGTYGPDQPYTEMAARALKLWTKYERPWKRQFLHRTGDVFNRHLGINSVLVEEIDDAGPETLQRRVGDLLYALRPAVQAASVLAVFIDIPSELGGDEDLVAIGRQRFAHEFFIRPRAVYFGGIEEGYAALHRSPYQ